MIDFSKMTEEEATAHFKRHMEVLNLKRKTGTNTFMEEASLKENTLMAYLVRDDLRSKLNLDERARLASFLLRLTRTNAMMSQLDLIVKMVYEEKRDPSATLLGIVAVIEEKRDELKAQNTALMPILERAFEEARTEKEQNK